MTQYRVFLKERKEHDTLVGQLDIQKEENNSKGPGYYGVLTIRRQDAVAKMKPPGAKDAALPPRSDNYGPLQDPQEIIDKVVEDFGHALEVEDEPYKFAKS